MDDCKAGGLQVERIMAGTEELWSSEYPAEAITDFSASTLQVDQITVTFSNVDGKPLPTYDLVNDDTDEVLIKGVTSGQVYATEEVSIVMRIDAVNNAGTTPSNLSTGTTKAPAGSQTFISSDTFDVPRGISSVVICMIGGGGGGSGYYPNSYTGGGVAGTIVSNQTVEVTPLDAISVICGAGGAGGGIGYGGNGSTSSFGSISASGGAGGGRTTGVHNGNGASRSTCYGTYNDGTNGGGDTRFRGGQAGFNHGGNARNYEQGGTAGSGSRGSGGGAADDRTGTPGAGGVGVVKVTWS